MYLNLPHLDLSARKVYPAGLIAFDFLFQSSKSQYVAVKVLVASGGVVPPEGVIVPRVGVAAKAGTVKRQVTNMVRIAEILI